MKNIINTISWFLSFAFAFSIFRSISWVWSFEVLFLWVIFWFIIKAVFFQKEQIDKAVDELEENVLKKINLEGKEEAVKDLKITEKVEIKEDKKEEVKIIKEAKTEEKIDKKLTEIKIEENIKQESYFWNFFKENLLAKLWSIIIFIWVVFLISVIWWHISDFTKMILWLAIWFSTYFIWVWLNKKNHFWESKILIWIWIWINFLVILASRHLLNLWLEEQTSIILTFLWLILNASLWIFSALKYKSNNILFFSFVFAYLNPLILWTSSEVPYTLLVYSLIISVSAIFIWEKYKNKNLIILSFILWNLLFLIAPSSKELWFLTKYTFTIILSFIYINIDFVKNLKENYLSSNIIIFSPILLQTIFKNTEITEIWYIYSFILAFIIFWYLFWKARTEKKEELLPIATTFLVFLFLAINFWEEKINLYVYIWVSILAFINAISTFLNKNLLKKENFWNYALSNSISAVFLLLISYFYLKHSLKIENIWIVFMAISAIYLLFSFINSKINSFKNFEENENKNIFILFLSIFLSFFSIWVALILKEKNTLIIPIIWLLEALLIYLIFNFTKEKKFVVIWNALSSFALIFLLQKILNLDLLVKWLEVYVVLIFIMLVISIYLVKELFNKGNLVNYNLWLHIFWIILCYISFWLANQETKVIAIVFSIFTSFLWLFYFYLKENNLKIFFAILIVVNMLFSFFTYIETKQLIAAITSIILFSSVVYFYNYKKEKLSSKLNTSLSLYLLLIVSSIIFELTKSTFYITIFWWIVWSAFIISWIKMKKVYFRTIWLYLISLISLKIVLFDIWVIWDWIIATVIFISLWIILIATSIIYTKYIWNNIWDEFSLKNLFWEKDEK